MEGVLFVKLIKHLPFSMSVSVLSGVGGWVNAAERSVGTAVSRLLHLLMASIHQ